MPIYQIYSSGEISESISGEIIATLTELHSNLLGSTIDEVVCISIPNSHITRGGEKDDKHIRVFGYIASGRSKDSKEHFLRSIKARLQPSFSDEFSEFTLAINLIEMNTNSSIRMTGAKVEEKDKKWEGMIAL